MKVVLFWKCHSSSQDRKISSQETTNRNFFTILLTLKLENNARGIWLAKQNFGHQF